MVNDKKIKLTGIPSFKEFYTEESTRRMEYKKREIIRWVQKMKWDYFITLTFRVPVNDDLKVNEITRKFQDILSAESFGIRSRKRIRMFAVIEDHKVDGKHIHFLMEDPVERITNPIKKKNFNLRDAIIESWGKASSRTANPAKSSSRHNDWIKEIDNVPNVIGYMIKRIEQDEDKIQWDLLSDRRE